MIAASTSNGSRSKSGLAGQTVLVTGGTGFIGGRLVEKLVLENGARVRVLVSDFRRASRIARYPVEMIPGTINDATALRRAVRGCSVAFHCAYGNKGGVREQWAVNVDGAEHVADAVLAEGAGRLVHVSSLAVYGKTGKGELDETAPRKRWGNPYAEGKREAEKRLLRRHRDEGLPVVILQPSLVYGPHSNLTVYSLQWLASGKVVLVDGGGGLCNCVYIDDVVDALILAAECDGVFGESFLISSGSAVPWREFFGAFERMLGVSSTVSIAAARCRRRALQQRVTPATLALGFSFARRHPRIRAWLTESRFWGAPGLSFLRDQFIAEGQFEKIHWPDGMQIDSQVMRTTLNIDKAKARLGYRPRFDLSVGMALTEKWARWARLIPTASSACGRTLSDEYSDLGRDEPGKPFRGGGDR